MKTWIKKARRGFTVTELAVVIAVVAIFMAVLLPVLADHIQGEREDTAQEQAKAEWFAYSAVTELPSYDGCNYLAEVTVEGTTMYYWIICGQFVPTVCLEKPESTQVTFMGEEAPTTLAVTDTQVNAGEGYVSVYENVKIYALEEV